MEANVIDEHWQVGMKPRCHPWMSPHPTCPRWQLTLYSMGGGEGRCLRGWGTGRTKFRDQAFESLSCCMSWRTCRGLKHQIRYCKERSSYFGSVPLPVPSFQAFWSSCWGWRLECFMPSHLRLSALEVPQFPLFSFQSKLPSLHLISNSSWIVFQWTQNSER